ncbi:hypothetical protein [Candidatus Vidania fulgoroideorum]
MRILFYNKINKLNSQSIKIKNIINRLDLDVMGLIIFCKKCFLLEKKYILTFNGQLYLDKIINYFKSFCFLKIYKNNIKSTKIKIYTGRKNQIRKQFSFINKGIIGDKKFGNFFFKKKKINLFFYKTSIIFKNKIIYKKWQFQKKKKQDRKVILNFI